MKIAVHMATLRGFGSGNVGRHLLREFEALAGPHAFEVWIPEVWNWRPGAAASRVVRHECQAGPWRKFALENITLRRRIQQHAADRLFSVGDTSLPACPVPHLLMVHQPHLAYLPVELDFAQTPGFRLRMWLMAHYFQLGLPTVTRIAVQTHAMRRRMLARWGLSADRIAVIPSSVDVPSTRLQGHHPANSARSICYVASPSLHKNHVVLADTMAALQRLGYGSLTCKLTVMPGAVPALVQRATELGVLDRFEFLGGVPAERALQLMAEAVVVVMPSKLESFGLPYYEALALGCPIVAADADFAREACGEVGRYAPPNDGAAFARQITNLLDSPIERATLSQAARARFDQINRPWSAIVADYVQLLETLI